jgi:alpha-N-arabinofuranosidase
MARLSTPAGRAALAVTAALLGAGSCASAGELLVRIDAAKTSAPVTPYQYGMFIEPIGGLIARGLWAEMLDDRKFFFPVVAEGKDPPLPDGAEGRPGMANRKWRPIGPEAAVTMDRQLAYAGAQSVAVTVDGGGVHGFGQGGLSLVKGKTYVGRAMLMGSSSAEVSVSLAWGPGPDQRQTVALPSPDGWFRSVSFSFTAGADASDARFEITGTGTGTFRIGAVSLMPDDNIDGWRADTTAILKTLHSGFWRLPGGNFLSDWDWHGAIGPRDRRAPMFDHAWSAMQPNDVGLDEFMTLTRLIGVEPYVTVNAGLGDANSAAEEVEYLNTPASTEWGAKRAANGHREPYGVRFWNIGNEPYGWWQIGQTTLDYFMIKHRDFAAAMKAVDPSIVLIGSGAMPDQMHPRDARENPSLESIQPRFGTDRDWTGGLFSKAWGSFDGVSEHWYDRAEKRPDAPPADELMEWVRSPSNQVRMKAEEWAIYQQRFPAMRQAPVFLSIDEYAYIGTWGEPPTLKTALAYSEVLQEMLRHTDFLKMSAFTTGVSTLDITPTASTLNATGEVFRLYGEHFGAGTIPVEVGGTSPQPDPKYPVGFDHPKVKAGSPTYPLDVVAGLSADRRVLKIAVVNPTFQPQPMTLSLAGVRIRGAGRVWRLTGASLAAVNKVGAPDGVTIREDRAPTPDRSLTVPPLSASIYEFPIADRP